MQPIPAFNPGDTTTYPNGNGVIQVGAADAGAKMLLYNESPFNINIDFLNGSQSILHAWEARYWTLDGDTRQVEWDINSTLNVTSSPISLVIGELYNAGEKLEGTYPMGLIRQTNVGNPGGIVSSASTIVNDGNALLEVIEATLSGHLSSDVIVNNDGSYTLKGTGLLAAVGVLTHILGTLTVDQASTLTGAVTAPAANVLGAVGVLQHILGTLTVDQLTTLTGGAQLPNNVALSALDATAASHDILKVATTNHVQILPAGSGIDQMDGSGNIILRTTSTAVIANQDLQMVASAILLDNNQPLNAKSSTGVAQVLAMMNTDNTARIASAAAGAAIVMTDNANALTTVNAKIVSCALGGNFKGISGTLSRFTFFTGTGSGTYSHSQGVTPQWVAAICNVAGSFTQGFDTPNSTTVHITCGAALAFTACVLNS